MGTALVTGCSTGIGYATALALAAAGHDVIATMRRPEADGERLLADAASQGLSLRVEALDVTDDVSVERAFAAAGPVDVLVNNAGVFGFGSVEESDVERWRWYFDTNLFGAVRCTRAALPAMRERGGCVVLVSSAAGRVALPAIAPYAASKAALESFGEITAIEGRAFGIRVVLVETGAVDTALPAKVTMPPRTSPYAPVLRNTLAMLRGLTPSAPTVLGAAIATAVADPSTPFRISAGMGSAELLAGRAAVSDEEWIDATGGSTERFTERFGSITGIDLRRSAG